MVRTNCEVVSKGNWRINRRDQSPYHLLMNHNQITIAMICISGSGSPNMTIEPKSLICDCFSGLQGDGVGKVHKGLYSLSLLKQQSLLKDILVPTTILLVCDKSLARSFSCSASVKFLNAMLPSDYGRKSLDYEPIQMEEKTIRMERSPSDISRDSFLNFLKKDAEQHTPENQDRINAAEEKALDSPSSQELALTSVKANGKRRPRSSLFTACICCSAAIH